MKKLHSKIIKAVLAIVITLMIQHEASAQLSPMGAMYFQNQYLGNPAMAGTSGGFTMALGYRKQWTNIPGSPSMQTLTADYALNAKVGLGLNVYNDKAGLFKRTRTTASYAYHLPLSSGSDKLSFGLAAGFMSERISTEDIIGSTNDAYIGNYNAQSVYIDGDFGVAYTNQHLNIQASFPNLRGYFKKELVRSVDRSTFFSAISYKINTDSTGTGFGIEPKLAFRGVKGYNSIIDGGVNLTHAKIPVALFGMYHSSGGVTTGLSFNVQNVTIQGIYTTATSTIKGFSQASFEVGLKLNLGH